jgi:hypothetical protein
LEQVTIFHVKNGPSLLKQHNCVMRKNDLVRKEGG